MHLISQSIVISDSSWYVLWFVTVFKALLDNLIRDSYDPPIHGLTDGLNFQAIPQFDISIWIFDWLTSWIAWRKSQSVAIKFVPLPLSISFGLPRGAMKCLKAKINMFVDKSLASSKWTAHVIRLVNNAPYRLCVACFNLVLFVSFMLIGPK